MNTRLLKLQKMSKKLIFFTVFLLSSLVQASPFVTTFVNTTKINMHLKIYFSDNSVVNKGLSMSQSYQAVSFYNKMIKSVVFSSSERDKKGNFYRELNKKFKKITSNETYNIALESVPAHKVPAGPGTEAFKMPESKKIVCNLVLEE